MPCGNHLNWAQPQPGDKMVRWHRPFRVFGLWSTTLSSRQWQSGHCPSPPGLRLSVLFCVIANRRLLCPPPPPNLLAAVFLLRPLSPTFVSRFHAEWKLGVQDILPPHVSSHAVHPFAGPSWTSSQGLLSLCCLFTVPPCSYWGHRLVLCKKGNALLLPLLENCSKSERPAFALFLNG